MRPYRFDDMALVAFLVIVASAFLFRTYTKTFVAVGNFLNRILWSFMRRVLFHCSFGRLQAFIAALLQCFIQRSIRPLIPESIKDFFNQGLLSLLGNIIAIGLLSMFVYKVFLIISDFSETVLVKITNTSHYIQATLSTVDASMLLTDVPVREIVFTVILIGIMAGLFLYGTRALLNKLLR